MEPRQLGKQGLTASRMRLDCIGTSDACGLADETERGGSIGGRPEHVREACDSSLEGDETMFETTRYGDVVPFSASSAEPAATTEALPAYGQQPASKRSEQPATTSLRQHTCRETSAIGSRMEAVGRELARYGLVVTVAWIGLMKFTTYEAEGISPFVANSPLMSWVYHMMSVRSFSALLGVVEVAVAILIAARPFSPRAAVIGSALAVGMFLATLSFLVTTPGVWEPTAGGFPALSAIPGQFLIKDLVLLGISVLTLGEGWRAATRNQLPG